MFDQFKDAQAIADAIRPGGDFDHGGGRACYLIVARNQVIRRLCKVVPRTDDLLPRRGRLFAGEALDQIELKVGESARLEDLRRRPAPKIAAVLQSQIAFAALFAGTEGQDQWFADARDTGRQINDQLRQRFGWQVVDAEFDGVGDLLSLVNRGEKSAGAGFCDWRAYDLFKIVFQIPPA